MNKGYVTFVNNNEKYLKLLEILIESVLLFSSQNIEVFSINFDYIHSSNRVLNRRINMMNETIDTIYFSKLYSSFNSCFEYGIQLDSDFIITKNMDKLFDDARLVGELPLGSIHPCDPNDQTMLMHLLNVGVKTQPYVHATYLFSDKSKVFLEECYKLSQLLIQKNIHLPNYDETLLNVMLWKYGSSKWVDCYDPYFDLFLNPEKTQEHGYSWMKNINFYSCHGIKDPLFARNVLDLLINEHVL